jgi:hypothetical protein
MMAAIFGIISFLVCGVGLFVLLLLILRFERVPPLPEPPPLPDTMERDNPEHQAMMEKWMGWVRRGIEKNRKRRH